MQNYSNHRITAQGAIITTDQGVEVLVPIEAARQLAQDLRRQLGDFSDQGDDKRPWPAPNMKYGSTERR